MYQYLFSDRLQKTRDDAILRISDKLIIPNDIDNLDWKEYLEWLGKGNVPNSPEKV